MVVQFYRYAQGRAENAGDLCGIDLLHKGFKDNHYSFLSLLKALIQSPEFTRLHIDVTSESSAPSVSSSQDEEGE